MPSALASSKSGLVAGDGISVSNQASISAWSVRWYRGKNVVRASSGNTTGAPPAPWPWCRSARGRSTTASLVSVRCTGPIWAAPTVTILVMASGYVGELYQFGPAVDDEVAAAGSSRDDLPTREHGAE